VESYDQDLSRIVEELNRAVPGARPADKPSPIRPPQNAGSLDQLLAYAGRQNASDLLLIAGTPVALRVNGALAPAAGPPLSPEDVRNFVLPLLDSRQYDELQKKRSVDFCFVRDPVGRFRANIHHQRGTLAASIRLLPARIPTIESLHRPPPSRASPTAARGWCWLPGPPAPARALRWRP
jgi:twitching motility protein PilT